MKALCPCHSSTPKSLSKSSVSVYQGMRSQPMRSFKPWISACGARETYTRVVSRAFTWAGCATGSAPKEQPAEAGLEQARRARGPVGALEAVLLLPGHPRHPPALRRHRVEGAGQLHLLDE